jgi:hypothetical protein
VNLFAVAVVADPARGAAVERSIVDAHRRTTPFAGAEHTTETWRGEHVVAASFSIHADRVAIGSYTRTADHAFDTFSGLPRLTALAAGRPWGEALGEARDAGRFDHRELGGVWALARATAHEVEVITSSTGTEQLVMARRPGLVLLANRSSLARLATWPEFPLAYDTDALTTMCARGWLAHDRVGFSGLELLPPGTRAHVTPDGVTTSVAQPLAGPGEAPRDDADVADVYDRMASEMVDAAREVGALGPRPRLELTGDVVTRLSAAAYTAADVEVTLVTPHAEDHPHAKVAAEVAAAAGLPHECAPVSLAPDELDDHLSVQVAQGEGLSNLYDPCPPVRSDPVVEVTRHAGGSLLGGYDNLASGPRPAVETVEAARSFLDDLVLHNHMLLLRDEARTAQQQTNLRTAEELLAEVGRLSFYELAYLRLREGRGTGANRQAAGYGALQAAPMLDDRVLRHLADLPLQHKRSQRAVLELLERLAPPLARVRFVGSRWRFEQDGPSELLDPDSWADREPLPSPSASIGPWRMTRSGTLPPALASQLAADSGLLDEVIDRRRLTGILRGEVELQPRDVRSLYGTATASRLLDGAWLPDNGSRRRRDRGGNR